MLDPFRLSLREYRNRLLRDSDWTQLSDAPISIETKAEWQVYRQALRDLPQVLGEQILYADQITEEDLPAKPE